MTTESRCRVCPHESRLDIERDAARGHSYRDIAKRHGISKDSVAVHLKEHADPKVLQARERREQMSTTIATEPAPLPEGGPWVHVVSMYGLCEVVGEALQGWPFLLEEVAKRVGEEVPQALHGPELGQTIQDQLPERVTRQRERAKRYGLGPRDQEVTGRIDGKWVDAVINLDTREVRPLQEVTTS